MSTLAEDAIEANRPSDDVAKAATKDAVASINSEAEKEALALALYKEATGRFPQDSSDRRSVYMGGFILVGLIFLVMAVLVAILLLENKTVPDSLWTMSTALVSGVVGGLFGYAKQ